MAQFKIRYFAQRKRNNGTYRYYWQPDTTLRNAGWKVTRLSDELDAAMAEAQEINKNVDQWRAGTLKQPITEQPGTINALIADYKNSRHYTEKSDNTQRDYAWCLGIISDWAGDAPVRIITAKMVQDFYEPMRLQKPRKGAYVIQVLRILFNHAERQSWIPKSSNPAAKPGLSYKAPKQKIWSPAAVRQFVRKADDMGFFSIGTAVLMNEWIGQRRGDIVTLRQDAYRDGRIYITQSKTGAPVVLPVDEVPDLKKRLEQQKKRNASRKVSGTKLIQRDDGIGYTPDHFTRTFNRIRVEVAKIYPELEELSFKNLRHTAVVRLAESGVDGPMIVSVTGHTLSSCNHILEIYNVRTQKAAEQAFKKRREAETKEKNT